MVTNIIEFKSLNEAKQRDLSYKTFFTHKSVSHDEALIQRVTDDIISIEMDEFDVSEKAFGAIDKIMSNVREFMNDNISIKSEILEAYSEGKRIKYIAEEIWHEYLDFDKSLNEGRSKSIESKKVRPVKDVIPNLKNISKENKEEALKLLKSYTSAKNSRIFELEIHPALMAKLREKNLPKGFSMGVDKHGWFIHTHRARSKSHDKPEDVTEKEIIFIDSTG